MTKSLLNESSLHLRSAPPGSTADKLTVICDANILYNSILRDLLIRLALDGHFVAHWTKEIEKEWSENLLKNYKKMTENKIVGLINAMNKALPNALLSDAYQENIGKLEPLLPDKQDAHVVAAAVACNAQLIVTYNLKDFPNQILKSYQIGVQHPDDFLVLLLKNRPMDFLACVKKAVEALHSIPSLGRYLDRLQNDKLINTATLVRRMDNQLSMSSNKASEIVQFDLTFLS